MKVLILLSGVLLGLLASTGQVAAQTDARSRNDPYGALLLQLGVGGEAEVEAAEDDLEVGYGAAFRYMHPLHRHFVLGGGLGFLSWQTESGDSADADRNLLFDLALVPAARLPVTDDVELYLGIPLGLTLDFFGEDSIMGPLGSVSADVDPGFGFTVSFLLGARFFLSESFGLLTELGYAIHSFDHEVSVNAAGVAAVSTDLDFDLGHIALHLGLFF